MGEFVEEGGTRAPGLPDPADNAAWTAPAAVGAANPCSAASARTALAPASDWNPPLAGCLMSVCSGAPCTGR